MGRPLCNKCGKEPKAVNCYRNGRIYYRTLCETCLGMKKNLMKIKPRWIRAGYIKKSVCEKCGFKPRFQDQLFVFFIDNDRNNIHISNIKTVCSNCQIELSIDPQGWRQGDLRIDL